jgi:hypothetical protein
MTAVFQTDTPPHDCTIVWDYSAVAMAPALDGRCKSVAPMLTDSVPGAQIQQVLGVSRMVIWRNLLGL